MMSISFLRYFQVERDNLAQAVYGTVLYEETFIQTWSFFLLFYVIFTEIDAVFICSVLENTLSSLFIF